MTSLNPIDTIGDQIAEVIRLHSDASSEEIRKKAEEMLELVGIDKTRYCDYPHQFSGGMAKKGRRYPGGDGLVSDNVEQTIANVGKMGHDGMRQTDHEILQIMTSGTVI